MGEVYTAYGFRRPDIVLEGPGGTGLVIGVGRRQLLQALRVELEFGGDALPIVGGPGRRGVPYGSASHVRLQSSSKLGAAWNRVPDVANPASNGQGSPDFASNKASFSDYA